MPGPRKVSTMYIMRSITRTQVTWRCSAFWGDVTFLDPSGCFHVFRSCCHVATKITQIHKPQKLVGSCRARMLGCCMCHHMPQHDSITVLNMLGVLRTVSYRNWCHQGDMWDAQLTSKGEEQAAELKPLMSREHVDLVVSSLVSQVERLLCASKIFLSSHPWYVMLPVFMTCAMDSLNPMDSMDHLPAPPAPPAPRFTLDTCHSDRLVGISSRHSQIADGYRER